MATYPDDLEEEVFPYYNPHDGTAWKAWVLRIWAEREKEDRIRADAARTDRFKEAMARRRRRNAGSND